jgi:hypothetical protein
LRQDAAGVEPILRSLKLSCFATALDPFKNNQSTTHWILDFRF